MPDVHASAANSLVSTACHNICSYSLLDLKVWIQFWQLLQHTIYMPQPSNIQAHFTCCSSQWRWMCPLHYSSFWVKWWTHVSRHEESREPVCSSFKWLKKWKGSRKFKLLWTSIEFLGTHHHPPPHTHTHSRVCAHSLSLSAVCKEKVEYSFHKSLQCNE